MNENPDRMNQLLEKLEVLSNKQETFLKEINELRSEIYKLKATEAQEAIPEEPVKEIITLEKKIIVKRYNLEEPKESPKAIPEMPRHSSVQTSKPPIVSFNLEKFIGENLINKIGIAITVIGVAIGAKYSIDHQLISPLTRILLGYLMGFCLLGIGLKLKKNYESYSAVLVSGAMAIMYFITYFAYSFYQLMPQATVFAIMVIITVFTVIAAINFNRQVIAHIGLVGAYAVPFLLSDGSGNASILFSYMAIINAGILVISFMKYWKPIYYTSFLLTWLIYFSWYTNNYQPDEHFGLAITFLIIFFLMFYVIFLAYKLRKSEKFGTEDIFLLLANSFIFYGIGYSILDGQEIWKHSTGVFTVCNALIHFIISLVIYKQKLADRNLFYFVSGLVIIFITIAIPVQFDGKWVTILWAGEAALLFWIGRTKAQSAYEKLSYPLVTIATYSLLYDWVTDYHLLSPEETLHRLIPLFNLNFLNSLLFIISLGFINLLNKNKNYTSALIGKIEFKQIIDFMLPVILLSVIYFSLRLEIVSYFHQLVENSAVVIDQITKDIQKNKELLLFKSLWMTIYTLLSLTALSYTNILKLKIKELAYINLALIVFAILVFLINDLFILGNLRETYLHETLSQYYPRGIIYLTFRYVSFSFIALILYTTFTYIKQSFLEYNLRINFDLLLHLTILWISSSELINWMDIAGSNQSYKLGLSILWGVYALFLISVGIWKVKKHLRIGAIVLFTITLIKLFTYDISHLDTISKTIVFVVLGILLLIISFLYNKYKHIISNENENN